MGDGDGGDGVWLGKEMGAPTAASPTTPRSPARPWLQEPQSRWALISLHPAGSLGELEFNEGRPEWQPAKRGLAAWSPCLEISSCPLLPSSPSQTGHSGFPWLQREAQVCRAATSAQLWNQKSSSSWLQWVICI